MRETERIRSLRAVRQFSDRAIPSDVLWDILEVGRWTDEGRLMQNLMLAAWDHGVGSCIASIYPRGRRPLAELVHWDRFGNHSQ